MSAAIKVRELSAAEAVRLKFALPELRTKEARLRQLAAAEGIAYEIPAYGGVRTEAEQAQLVKWRDEAVKAGRPYYQVAPFGKSMHEVGAAFDMKVITRPAGMSADAALRRLGVLGESLGLEWGGRWSGQTNDPFHLELTGARSSYVAQYQANRVMIGGDLAQLTPEQARTAVGTLAAAATCVALYLVVC